MKCKSAVSELKELKDDQEMMLGDMERSVDQLSIAEDLDQFKVDRVNTLIDVEKSDEHLCTTSDVEQSKDGRESTLADTEGSDDKLNAAEGGVERGELFMKLCFIWKLRSDQNKRFASYSFKGVKCETKNIEWKHFIPINVTCSTL